MASASEQPSTSTTTEVVDNSKTTEVVDDTTAKTNEAEGHSPNSKVTDGNVDEQPSTSTQPTEVAAGTTANGNVANGNGATAKVANGNGDEIVDIEDSSKSMMRRMAGMNPDKYPGYLPQPRSDTSEYVFRKTARSRKMVVDQDQMLYNLQTMHTDLDHLDREVTQMQEQMRQQRNQRRYHVPKDGASFVIQNPEKYSLWDYTSRYNKFENNALIFSTL